MRRAFRDRSRRVACCQRHVLRTQSRPTLATTGRGASLLPAAQSSCNTCYCLDENNRSWAVKFPTTFSCSFLTKWMLTCENVLLCCSSLYYSAIATKGIDLFEIRLKMKGHESSFLQDCGLNFPYLSPFPQKWMPTWIPWPKTYISVVLFAYLAKAAKRIDLFDIW